jgi:hypothetical protein
LTDELQEYLATFIFNEDNYTVAAGKLRINITGLVEYHVDPSPELDILQLLVLHQKMPKSMTKFVTCPSEIMNGGLGLIHAEACIMLQLLLNHHNKAWSDYILGGKIRRIMASFAPHLKVCIALEKDQIPWHIHHKWKQANSAIERTRALTDAFGFHPFVVDDIFEFVVADGP